MNRTARNERGVIAILSSLPSTLLFTSKATRFIACAFAFILAFPTTSPAQKDSVEINSKKLRTIAIISGVGYTGGLITLNHVWYENNERQSFRFFNDNAEWKQVDKIGHFASSYWLSEASSVLLNGCGVPARKSDIIGAVSGFLLTIPIEIFDGYSVGYGASAGDAVADAAGPLFFLSQKLLWNEVRLRPKFSFHRTGYAPLRPELLGDNLLSETVKDYNGQTFWLSVDVDKFTAFPEWLNIAFGYGAQDMIYARDHENKAAGFDPFRQYYIAVDFDLTAIKTRSKVVRTLLYIVNTVRLPGPAVEFSRHGGKFHAFYF